MDWGSRFCAMERLAQLALLASLPRRFRRPPPVDAALIPELNRPQEAPLRTLPQRDSLEFAPTGAVKQIVTFPY
jgi:hypothetical protein